MNEFLMGFINLTAGELDEISFNHAFPSVLKVTQKIALTQKLSDRKRTPVSGAIKPVL